MYLFQAQRSARARTHGAFLQYASFSYILIPSDDAKGFCSAPQPRRRSDSCKVRHTEVPGKHYLSPLKKHSPETLLQYEAGGRHLFCGGTRNACSGDKALSDELVVLPVSSCCSIPRVRKCPQKSALSKSQNICRIFGNASYQRSCDK